MFHLPAYVALRRWASGRTIVVVDPCDLEGPLCLRNAGASVCIVNGPDDAQAVAHGFTTRRTIEDIGPRRVDVVVCIEAYEHMTALERAALREGASARLTPDGLFAAWVSHHPKASSELDFWTFEDELRLRYPRVYLIAALPWNGVSLAPVVDPPSRPMGLVLDESALEGVPQASHYLAVACRGRAPLGFEASITGHCLMVPMQIAGSASESRTADDGAGAAVDPESARGARTEAVRRTTSEEVAILRRSVDELEQSLARAEAWAQRRSHELETLSRGRDALQGRVESLLAERDNLRTQLEVALAEREGAFQLLARVEADLELSRRKCGHLEKLQDSQHEELNRLNTQVEVLRARLEDAQSRQRELSVTAAQSVEQSRSLAEVALDRDRLREELGKRASQIQALEERVWRGKEELQKERVETTRLNAEVERLRERYDRAHEAETSRADEVARLGHELHTLEVEHARLGAQLRSREDELGRWRQQPDVLPDAGDDVHALCRQVADQRRELEACNARLEDALMREAEAVALAKRRSGQLAESGAELEDMRRSVDENASTARNLRAELDVKALQLEQLAASVGDLQGSLEGQKRSAIEGHVREAELQQKLERSQADRDALQRRLKQREQELEDLMCAHETSGVEVYKLRRELEATAHANERLEEALGFHRTKGTDVAVIAVDARSWPEAARLEVRRLREQLAAQAQEFAAHLASDRPPGDLAAMWDERSRRLLLEAEIRAQEHEHALVQLDTAEQRIWEMTDAADRNAARLAASLAQLEKHKEELEEKHDELDVTRNLLATAQARSLELERLLASERARIARMGGRGTVGPPLAQELDDVFSELECGSVWERRVSIVPSAEPNGAVPGREGRDGPRVVVEPLADQDWPADGANGASRGTAALTMLEQRAPHSGS